MSADADYSANKFSRTHKRNGQLVSNNDIDDLTNNAKIAKLESDLTENNNCAMHEKEVAEKLAQLQQKAMHHLKEKDINDSHNNEQSAVSIISKHDQWTWHTNSLLVYTTAGAICSQKVITC